MRFEAWYERRQRRTLTRVEAAEIFGITERTCRRWRGRYVTEGAEGGAGSADRPSLGPRGTRG